MCIVLYHMIVAVTGRVKVLTAVRNCLLPTFTLQFFLLIQSYKLKLHYIESPFG